MDQDAAARPGAPRPAEMITRRFHRHGFSARFNGGRCIATMRPWPWQSTMLSDASASRSGGMAAGNGPDRIFGGYQGLDWLPGQILSAFLLASVARILYPVCASHATGVRRSECQIRHTGTGFFEQITPEH